MLSLIRKEHPHPNSGSLRRVVNLLAVITPFIGIIPEAWAAELYSVHVDRSTQKIIVKGSGFNQAMTVTLGGIAVIKGNVTANELEIPFASEVYAAVQWEASYNLVIDGTNRISVYIDAPILAPPPAGGPDCPCLAQWQAYGFPYTFCGEGSDGTQSYIYASAYNAFLSAAFDPNNILFDPVNPGNSISYCALLENDTYIVAEPVVNQDQYSDCYNWMWANVCL